MPRTGELLVASAPGIQDKFEESKIQSRGFGLLDLGFKDASVGYAAGGSGSLFRRA